MPFEAQTMKGQKLDFVMKLESKELSMSELCRRYGITRKTGYKWYNRYKEKGITGLEELNRAPHHRPGKIDSKIEKLIVEIRENEPDWGAKKIFKLLQRDHKVTKRPSVTTINNVLKRNGLISPEESMKNKPIQRFEHELPNSLWQMDFKGDFVLKDKTRCFPLTIIDDHSRSNLCLEAMSNQRYMPVKERLTKVFSLFGLPDTILCDNGGPWGLAGNGIKNEARMTRLEIWLLKQDVKMIHGRPYHPQTQGKLERYHRTMKRELLSRIEFKNYKDCQDHFDKWRNKYNHIRPHESLGQEIPASRYSPSKRAYNPILPEPNYLQDDIIRKVYDTGSINFKGKSHRVGKALNGEVVALRRVEMNKYEVYFYRKRVKMIKI